MFPLQALEIVLSCEFFLHSLEGLGLAKYCHSSYKLKAFEEAFHLDFPSTSVRLAWTSPLRCVSQHAHVQSRLMLESHQIAELPREREQQSSWSPFQTSPCLTHEFCKTTYSLYFMTADFIIDEGHAPARLLCIYCHIEVLKIPKKACLCVSMLDSTEMHACSQKVSIKNAKTLR